MGVDVKAAFTKALNRLNIHIYQPIAGKLGAFRNYIVLVLGKAKPTLGLRSGKGAGGQPPVSLLNRVVTFADVQKIPKAHELTQEQKKKLDQWVEREPGASLKNLRREAVDRIIKASITGSREISFADLYLTGLPDDILAEMPFITKLDLTNCLLTQMPSCIKKLPYLQELNLSGLDSVDGWEISKENFKNIKRLSLDHCKLRNVPDIVNRCPALTHLSLQSNQLKAIPEIPPNLRSLNLDHNYIDSLPESLSKKRKHQCVVMLDFNHIQPQGIRTRISQMRKGVALCRGRQEEMPSHPRIILYHTGRVDTQAASQSTTSDLVMHWFQIGGLPLPEGVIERFEGNETIRLFLSKMIGTADYLKRERFDHLAARVCTLLVDMENDEEVYEACYDAIQDATASCADRASRGLSEAEFALQTVKAQKVGKDALIQLGDACYRKALVDSQALKQFGNIDAKSRDDVETILFYEIYFAKKFNLPIDSEQKMRYRWCVNVTQKDLDLAEAEIQSTLSNRTGDDRCSFFAGWKPWREYLQSTPEFEDGHQKINAEYSEKIDELNIDPTMSDPDNIPSNEELQKYYSFLEQREKAIEKLYKQETLKLLA